MKKVSPHQMAEVIFEVLQQIPADKQKSILPAVVDLLFKYKLISKADRVLSALEKLYNQADGVVLVQITSARSLSEEQRKSIKQQMVEALDKKVIIKEIVDEKIGGGAILRYQDILIDGSVSRQLSLLKQSLVK